MSLFHFTDAEAVYSILLNKSIWLTDLRFLNDSRELYDGVDAFSKALENPRHGLFTNNDYRKKSTEYHNIVLWRRLAEIASQYLKKGSLVLIEGRLQTSSWEDGSGKKRYKTEIVAEQMQLAPKSISNNPDIERKPIDRPMGKQEIKEEEIPIIEEDKGEINVEEIPF